ncbi:4-hydroxy-tetrahydrodipicolinate synthase family protein [Streptomyces iranensis]|uniref:4-hydroxy-tetrahydrodipicolinate synthase family protein n=1 Tax=Streptomyces iranensis TaxID=576784 RepID=UPI0039B768C4
MMPHTPLDGIHVPLITPFTADGRIAETALERLAHSMLDAGAAGLVALGTTGEPATLTPQEKTAVIDVCARVCRDRRAALTVGAGSNATLHSTTALAELSRWPEATGALVPVPYFTRPSPDGVLAHFAELAAGSPVPLIAYHIPYRTGRPLDAQALRELGRLPGVAGVKYATGGVDQTAVALLGDLPADFAVVAGDDAFISPLLALGAAGGILASAHLAPERFVELATAWRNGDLIRARELGHVLATLSTAAFAEPNPTVIKGVLHAEGRIPTPDVRLPLLPAEPTSVDAALKCLADLG